MNDDLDNQSSHNSAYSSKKSIVDYSDSNNRSERSDSIIDNNYDDDYAKDDSNNDNLDSNYEKDEESSNRDNNYSNNSPYISDNENNLNDSIDNSVISRDYDNNEENMDLDNNLNESQFNDEDYALEEQNLDENMPERKIRYRIFKFINKLRVEYKLEPLSEDSLGNDVAMNYAKYLLNNKENEHELANMFKENYLEPSEYKTSSFSSFIDLATDNLDKEETFDTYTSDFMDCHATLLEFEKDRNLIISNAVNTIGIGLAFDKEKIVVVNIYSNKLVSIDLCSMIAESNLIYLEGKVLSDKYGVYLVRIVEEQSQNKPVYAVNPQDIKFDPSTRRWECKFKNVGSFLKDLENENNINKHYFVVVYLRDKPELIKYGETIIGQIKVRDLILGCKSHLFHFPHPIMLKEYDRIDIEDKENLKNESSRKAHERLNEENERKRREAKVFGELKPMDRIDEVNESENDETDSNFNINKDDSENKYNNINLDKSSESKELNKDISKSNIEKQLIDENNYKREDYDTKLYNLEQTIEQLKKENDEVQRKIALIFEYKKLEGKEDKKHYKEANINESTYHDTLTTAANLYNDLHTHRTKLNADLSKYDQSIRIQEERKKEVYKILMNYKEELINNAETNKGSKINPLVIERWLNEEKIKEDEIRDLRIQNIKNTLRLNRINKELKKTEEYFEGLHYIDFEQLKIENNTLTEKIEDLNEDIHKYKNTINQNIQILAHTQEKYDHVYKETKLKEKDEKELKEVVRSKKDKLKEMKSDHEKNSMKNYNEKKRIDDINSPSLIRYYKKSYNNIKEYYSKIQETINKIEKLRGPKNMKDVNLHKKRADELFYKEYQNLIAFDETDKIAN